MEAPPATSKPSFSEPTDAARPPSFESITTRDATWQVREGWRERLLGLGAPDLFSLDREHSATRIKSGRRRTIWRVSRQNKSFICKVYRDGDILRRFGSVVFGSSGQRECETAQVAVRLGVPVPEPIAWARKIGPPHDSIVITEELRDASPLASIAPEARRDRSLLEAVAALFAQAHEAGFTHLDGHPGNVLVRRDTEGHWRAWFVDMHDLKQVRGGLSLRRTARALGQLEHHYARECPTLTRLRFLRTYLQHRARAGQHRAPLASARILARAIQRAAQMQAVRLAWRRDRRLRRNGGYFTSVELDNGWTARVLLKLGRRRIDPAPHIRDRSEAEWRNMLSEPIANGRLEVGRAGSPRWVRCGAFALLVWDHNSLVDRILASMSGTPAHRLFERTHHLRHRDLRTPISLGFGAQRNGVLVRRSFLILPDHTPAGHWERNNDPIQ